MHDRFDDLQDRERGDRVSHESTEYATML